MATAAGPRSAGCRARPATARAWRRCGARCAPPPTRASKSSPSIPSRTENWSRPQAEVRFLLELLRRFIRTDVAELHQSNVRIMIIGDRDGLERGLRTMFEEAETLTRDNTGLKLVIAFNYGSRQEITRAVRAAGAEGGRGQRSPPTTSRRRSSASISTRLACPTPTCSSAPAASSASPITCCGNAPIPSSCSCPSTGRSSTARAWPAPSRSSVRVTVASVVSRRRRPDERRASRSIRKMGRSRRQGAVCRRPDPGRARRCLGGRHLVLPLRRADRHPDGAGMGEHRPQGQSPAVRAPCGGRHVRRAAAARRRPAGRPRRHRGTWHSLRRGGGARTTGWPRLALSGRSLRLAAAHRAGRAAQ